MQKLTAATIEKMINDEANIKVMTSLFQAEAFSKMITEIVEKKQREILAFYKWGCIESALRIEGVPKVITEPRHAYLLPAEDAKIYFDELDKFYQTDECPVKPKNKGCCPALEAQSLVREIKCQIADFFKPYFGFGYDEIVYSLKTYKDYFDLLMTMFAHKIKVV